MGTANKLSILHQSKQTVFSTNELMLYWKIEHKPTLYTQIARMKTAGFLMPIQRGLYALSGLDINEFELASNLKKRSYLSFETVLTQNGVIHQWYGTYFLASDRSVTIQNQYGKFNYRSLAEKILDNRLGILPKNNYFIASTERAICDYFYKVGFQQLDDLSKINKGLLIKIAQIYQNKRLEQDITKLIKII